MPSQVAVLQPASSPCSVVVAPEKQGSLLVGGVWEPQSPAVPPPWLLCHRPLCQQGDVVSDQALWFLVLLWVSVLGLLSDCSPGSACAWYRSGHNMAMLTISVLDRGKGSAPSAHRPHFLLWDTITLICQRGTFWGYCILSCHRNTSN